MIQRVVIVGGRITTYYKDGETWRLGVKFLPDGMATDAGVERKLKEIWHRLAHEFGSRREGLNRS